MPELNPHQKKMLAIKNRADRALLNADNEFIDGLVEVYRAGATTPEQLNALELLKMFATMSVSLANDIEFLLVENHRLQEELRLYRELERPLK